MKNYSPEEMEGILETDKYIYLNPLTSWITKECHKACAKLRKFDLQGYTVVDLGCGKGEHFPFIKNAEIIGVDVLPEMLAQAEKKYPGRAQLLQESIFDLSFADKSQKSIVSVGVLEHVKPLEKALEEIRRVLSDDGEFIFGIPTEGFLYKIGRTSVKKHVEKHAGVDYDELLAKEHVNECKDILSTLNNFFNVEKVFGVPFRTKSINLNIFLVGRCTRRDNI